MLQACHYYLKSYRVIFTKGGALMVNPNELERKVLEALKTVIDPEIGISIVDLGLIREITADKDGNVHIKMTLTTPGCPLMNLLLLSAEEAAKSVEGVKSVKVELVF